MMDQLQTARLAMALNDVAAALQQLAVVVHHSGPTPPAKQLAELRAQLLACSCAGGAECSACLAAKARKPDPFEPVEVRMAKHGLYPDGEPPASVAEPECGCSLYARCDAHDRNRPRGCKCNGPAYASSACPLTEHRHVARAWPDRDPALID